MSEGVYITLGSSHPERRVLIHPDSGYVELQGIRPGGAPSTVFLWQQEAVELAQAILQHIKIAAVAKPLVAR